MLEEDLPAWILGQERTLQWMVGLGAFGLLAMRIWSELASTDWLLPVVRQVQALAFDALTESAIVQC